MNGKSRGNDSCAAVPSAQPLNRKAHLSPQLLSKFVLLGLVFSTALSTHSPALEFSLQPIPPEITRVVGMNDLGSVVGEDNVTPPVARYFVWRPATGLQQLDEFVHAISNAEEITTQFSTSTEQPIMQCGFSGCIGIGTQTVTLPQTSVNGVVYANFGLDVAPPATVSAHQFLGKAHFITSYEEIDESVTYIYPTTESGELTFANGTPLAPPPAVPFASEDFVRGYNGRQLLWDGDHTAPDFTFVPTSLYLQDLESGSITDVGQLVADQVPGIDPNFVQGGQVTDDGDVLVAYSLNGQQHSALWHADEPLEPLGNATFQPHRINQLEWGIGNDSRYWDGTQVVDVNTLLSTAAADWEVSSLVLMNNSGQFVAQARQNGGPVQHVLLTPDFITRWQNPVDGEWADGTKWDRGSPPESDHIAVFDLPNSYSVAVDGHVTTNGLEVLQGDVTFDLSQGALTVTDSITTNGIMRAIGDGGVIVSAAVTAEHAATQTFVAPTLAQTASDPPCNANGTICLPSPWRARNGSFFTNNADVIISELVVDGISEFAETGGRSLFDLSGFSTLTTEHVVIGDDQGGYLNLKTGSQFNTKIAIIGNDHNLIGPDGDGVLVNDDGLWQVGESLKIGHRGVGRVTVIGGGALNSTGEFKVAQFESSSGTLEVAGRSAENRSRVTFTHLEVSVSGSGLEPGQGHVTVAEGGELVVRPGTGSGGGKITIGKHGTLDITSSETDHLSYVGTEDPIDNPVELVIDWATRTSSFPPRFSSQTAQVNVGEGGFLFVNEVKIGLVGNGELSVVSADPNRRALAWITKKLTLGSLLTRGEVLVDAGGSVIIGPSVVPEPGVFRVGPGGTLAGSGKITAPTVNT